MKPAHTLAALAAAGCAALAFAQQPQTQPPLSPPVAGVIPGQGPGFHDPRSAFKPLEEREGIVSWKLLSSVTTRVEKNRVVPTFPAPVSAMEGKTVRVQGFMMPLEPGASQRHFLLSSVPTSCGFCIPAGPEGLLEVRSKTPVKYSLEPVVVEGKFAALEKDPYGLFYRVTDALPMP